MLEKTNKQKLVVIGNGMAGIRTVETLLERAPDLYDITVFGSEPYGNYNRILLSPVLAGEKSVDDIMLNTEQWYDDNGITLRKGETIAMIDRRTCEVVTAEGARVPYDRLLIATGSNPIMLPLPGNNLHGVIGFRDIQDVERMVEASTSRRNAVVIGGGLLGLEAANGLMKRGMNVTVVHLLDTPDGAPARSRSPAACCASRWKSAAWCSRCRRRREAILGEDRVTAVRFADGEELPADLVVMAVGIRPNIELAQKAGLHCERGIVVSDTMQTYDGRIYAVGECVQHRRQTYGLVAPLFDQAKVCANHLAMKGFATYDGSVVSTKLKVTGIDLFSAGDFAPGADKEEIVHAGRRPRRLQADRSARQEDRRRRALRRYRRRPLVLPASARRHRYFADARAAGVRRRQSRRRRPRRPEFGRRHERRGRNLRLQRRLQGHHRQGDRRKEAVHDRRRARPHQGFVVLRLLHRPRRAGAGLHARRRLFGGAEGQADVQMHRSQP